MLSECFHYFISGAWSQENLITSLQYQLVIVVWLLPATCLVCLGAQPDVKNNENKTPYDLAKEPETAALLQHAGKTKISVLCGNMGAYSHLQSSVGMGSCCYSCLVMRSSTGNAGF